MYFPKIKKSISIVLIFFSFLGGNFSCSNKDRLSKKDGNNIEIVPTIKGVAALGQLSPSGEVRKLASPTSQFGTFPRLVELLVKEGDFVKKDSILAKFENREKLKSELEKKEKLLITIKNEINLKEDQLKRYQLALDNEAYSMVLLLRRKEELVKLKKQLIINTAEKKSIEIDLFNSQLRSPIDGYILSINTRVGERSNSDGILEIGASQNMEAIIEVYESDIDRVFINQEVRLSSENGGFDETLIGKVIRINPQVKQRKVLSTDPTGDADARIIEVLVRLDLKSRKIVMRFAGMKVIAIFLP